MRSIALIRPLIFLLCWCAWGFPAISRTAASVTQSFSCDRHDRLNTDLYDNNGNTLFGAGFGQFQPDQYDFENRLISRQATVNGQPTTINIWYDGDGHRVNKTVTTPTNSVTTFYVVDDQNPTGYAQVLEEHVSQNSSTPTLQVVYVYGHTLISQDRLARTPGPDVRWVASFYGYDGHNNVRYLTDTAGNITDTFDYDAFGNLIARTGDTPNNYLYCGEQYDPDLGLYFLRARYMNPDTGRFWTMDSFEGFGWDPISLHKYLYADADPVNTVDPLGLFSLTEMKFTLIRIGQIARMVANRVASAVKGLYRVSQQWVKRELGKKGTRYWDEMDAATRADALKKFDFIWQRERWKIFLPDLAAWAKAGGTILGKGPTAAGAVGALVAAVVLYVWGDDIKLALENNPLGNYIWEMFQSIAESDTDGTND